MPKIKIAVDLDGTLVEYHGWKGPTHIGKIIMPMFLRVAYWLEKGYEVVIFTARIHNDPIAEKFLRHWLNSVGLEKVGITNIKTPDITQFWDDRAVGVEFNTGEPTSIPERLL